LALVNTVIKYLPNASFPFHQKTTMPEDVLHKLMRTIEARKENPPPKSYTSKLFAGGTAAIAAKIMEEAAEVVEAAEEPDDAGRTHLVAEAGDLLYHLLVMLAARDARLEDVEAELASRFGISGIEEKESRGRAT
jgi:phosphoribosyl-ATP pyrophosphohydrolase